MSQQVSDSVGLTKLTLIWMFHSSFPAALPIRQICHQPKQNGADSGTIQIKVNPTQVRDVLGTPCILFQSNILWKGGGPRLKTYTFRSTRAIQCGFTIPIILPRSHSLPSSSLLHFPIPVSHSRRRSDTIHETTGGGRSSKQYILLF